MPALINTLAGLHAAIEGLREEVGKVDGIFQEINGKVMASPVAVELKSRWQEIYRAWTPIALKHPIVRDADPRISRNDLIALSNRIRALRVEGLKIYAEWKRVMAPYLASSVGEQSLAPRPPSMAGQIARLGPIKMALWGGGIVLGGYAAYKIVKAISPSPGDAQKLLPHAPPPSITQIVLPSAPALSAMPSISELPSGEPEDLYEE